MKYVIVVFFFLMVGGVWAAEESDLNQVEPVELERLASTNRLFEVHVDGLVCSVCAYGMEKKLSEIKGIDTTLFGEDGVYMDIEKGAVLLAFKPDYYPQFSAMKDGIEEGGYDVRSFLFSIKGRVMEDAGRYVLADLGYTFVLLDLGGNVWGRSQLGKQVDLDVKFEIKKRYKEVDILDVTVLELREVF